MSDTTKPLCANCGTTLDTDRALWWCPEGDAITVCCSESCAALAVHDEGNE